MAEKTAWNSTGMLNPKFLGSWDVPTNGTLIVKIKSVSMQEIDNHRTNKKEQKMIIELCNYKPMVCNITNAKAINKALGSNYIEDWEGKYIEIGTKSIRAFGANNLALRVKDIAPPPPVKQKPILTPEGAKWQSAIDFMMGGGNIQVIRDSYNLSSTDENELMTQLIDLEQEKEKEAENGSE